MKTKAIQTNKDFFMHFVKTLCWSFVGVAAANHLSCASQTFAYAGVFYLTCIMYGTFFSTVRNTFAYIDDVIAVPEEMHTYM